MTNVNLINRKVKGVTEELEIQQRRGAEQGYELILKLGSKRMSMAVHNKTPAGEYSEVFSTILNFLNYFVSVLVCV